MNLPRRRGGTGLAAAQVGVLVRLGAVEVDGTERLRLAEFGLRPGAVVTVLSHTAGGGRLVGFGANRIVLDRRTAGRLTVEGVA
ncbi:FeoA family protein [Speluncibacter jeojiensis]|uniref:Ferrous iron transport protein A n=1 Tax=Speluncibacter jeojiensis TaxID=2710754 RepID=A0A9X4M2I3_9ACTN|nr:ferrous iron transport protein A [Corynebacteriales bacterium D3-21]